MEQKEIEYFIEAALLAAGRPLNLDQLQSLFDGRSTPDKGVLREAIKALNEGYEERGIEIAEVASGFRMQVKASMSERLQRLWEERPPRYSRALFETLALIAYRQPITRGEIEEVRGVSVSSNIMRSLMEREWVRVVGHRDVPGRPAMYGTTKAFLDYFGLKKLDDLPELADLSDWESLRVQLDLPTEDGEEGAVAGDAGEAAAVSADDASAALEDEELADAAEEAAESGSAVVSGDEEAARLAPGGAAEPTDDEGTSTEAAETPTDEAEDEVADVTPDDDEQPAQAGELAGERSNG